MTFTELLTEVYNITGRADLIDLTKTAVKAATLKAHQTDFYSKDLYELTHTFSTAEYLQEFDYASNISNYRGIKYIRKVDSTGTPSDFIDVITPEEVLDRYNRELTDVCYVAGRVISIKSSTEFDTMIIACYVNPIIIETSYSSWIADLQPYAIIHEAARVVLATIALQAESNAQRELVAEQYAELKINHATDYVF